MLCDRFVCGCTDKRLQCKLLAEHELTFEQAFKTLRAFEAAEHESRVLHPSTLPQVHFTASKNTPTRRHLPKSRDPPKKPCYPCGGKHLSDTCKFKTATCNYCHKQGHIAKVYVLVKRAMQKQREMLNLPTKYLQGMILQVWSIPCTLHQTLPLTQS